MNATTIFSIIVYTMLPLQRVNNEWGNTEGFSNNNWFWADPASEKMVVCRMKLAECGKLINIIVV